MDIYREILSWSENIPEWSRDALRRLVIKGYIDRDDINDFVDLIKEKYDLLDKSRSEIIEVEYLEEGHIPCSDQSNKKVILDKIDNVVGVNALVTEQSLDFGNTGITVIYGDNGSGKSGYARILKRLCRARGHGGPIHPNVFDKLGGDPPSAKIHYKLDSEARVIDWKEGENIPSELSNISVFDSNAASVYLNDENDVAYLPAGLDLLNKLASACLQVKNELDDELFLLQSQVRSFTDFNTETKSGIFVNNLSHKTDIKQIEEAARWEEKDAEELLNIQKKLAKIEADDPEKKKQQLTLMVPRWVALSNRIDRGSILLSDSGIQTLNNAYKKMNETAKTAELSSREAFKDYPVTGVGEHAWKLLWDAAEKYSEQYAYPGRDFPVVDDGAVCVLCQRELDGDSKIRFSNFDTFVKEKFNQEAIKAKSEFELLLNQLKSFSIEHPIDSVTFEEMREVSPGLKDKVECYQKSWVNLKNEIISLYDKKIEPKKLALSFSPKLEIDEVVNECNAELQKPLGATDLEKKKKLHSDKIELEDKKKLHDRKSDVIAHVLNLKKIDNYYKCIKETSTTNITLKSKDLTEKAVTNELVKKFNIELDNVGLKDIKVEMKAVSGKRGSLYHSIVLASPTVEGVSVSDVVSDGENRRIALAGFLSELSTASAKSGIVFDDPVSSVDHLGREAISKRLVEEAKDRQVIVFTHEVTFMFLLDEEIEKQKVDCKYLRIEKRCSGPGFCDQEHPWKGLTAKHRVAFLKNELPELHKLYKEDNMEEYVRRLEWLYGRLREAWEKAIEELFFNSVIVRFRRGVETGRLRKFDYKEEDIQKIDQGMARCSIDFAGHDNAAELNVGIRKPEDLEADIKYLEDWVNELIQRRKG